MAGVARRSGGHKQDPGLGRRTRRAAHFDAIGMRT